MAKSKTIKGYFLRPVKQSESPDANATSEEILGLLDYIGSLSLSERNYETEERTIILQHDTERVAGIAIPKYEGYVSGLMLRKRDVSLPMTGIEDGEILDLKPIDLGGGTLMEVTYFMVHRPTGILLFLVNRSAGSFIDLAQKLSGYLGSPNNPGYRMRSGSSFTRYLYLANILNSNSLQRVEDLFAVKSLDFRFVGDPIELRRFLPNTTNRNINSIMDINDYFEGFNISVVIKPKRGEKLQKHKIAPFFQNVERVLRLNEKSKFIVSGSKPRSRTETIDLLNDKFLFTTTIKYEGEYIPALEVFNAMQLNFEERLPAMVDAPIE